MTLVKPKGNAEELNKYVVLEGVRKVNASAFLRGHQGMNCVKDVNQQDFVCAL